MSPQPIVVFDTNVLIPLILPGRLFARLFSRLRSAGWWVAVSPQILAEVRDKMLTKKKLRQWLRVTDAEITTFVDNILPGKTRSIPGVRNAHGAVPKDPKDDIIIAAALESGADYIVTEDRHILELGEYQGVQIMTRDQFAAELERLGVPQLKGQNGESA